MQMDYQQHPSGNSNSLTTIKTADIDTFHPRSQNYCDGNCFSIPSQSNHKDLWVDGEGAFVCIWLACQQRFITVEQLDVHLEKHLIEYTNLMAATNQCEMANNLVCQIQGCQILVTSTEELGRHMKMHIFHANRLDIGLRAVKERCPNINNCNFVATSRLVYQGDPLLCEWNACFGSFTDINKFVEHVELHIHLLSTAHQNADGLCTCLWNECQATFKNKTHLARHIQHHSGDKKCACPFCGAFFSNIPGLINHVKRKQDGDSSLICHFCQKTFFNEALLRKHCKRHVKSLQCPYCSLVLIAPYDLNRHVQTVHAKVRNHICEHCGKAFYQRSDLNKHVELHFNDAMHECTECGKKFRWSKQLREHYRQHNEDYNPAPYECHLCNNTRYARGSALSKHFITMHKMSVPKGFCRFQYKKCQDGFFRLQPNCYMRNNFEGTEEENAMQ